MPCMDYDSRWDNTWKASYNNEAKVKEMKKHTDKLARIACKAMDELVKSGYADFLLLKDDEVREWYEAHLEADRLRKEKEAEKRRKAKVKKDALAKLSDEEKKVLGIKK